MPAKSKAQRTAAAIAEHHPEKLYPENRSMAKMSKAQLHEFASGSGKELPHHVRKGAPIKIKPCHGPMK